MSSSSIVHNDKKPITGAFELETKIRVIIQEVLAATVRKLGLFGEKVQKFQEYFITFKERFETGERERQHLQNQLTKVSDMQTNIRRDLNFQEIKQNEEKERMGLQGKESKEQLSELQKGVKSLLRQNENINSELSKTKAKFLEYSQTITALKEEVSWKITKYLEETAESHTQMKIYSQEIKIDNFNMNLQIQKQKEKYDQIILKYEEDLTFRQETALNIQQLATDIALQGEQLKKADAKLADTEMTVLARVKAQELKFEDKLRELDKNNSKLTTVSNKIDNFNQILESLKQEIELAEEKQASRLEQLTRQLKEEQAEEVAKVTKLLGKAEKKWERSVAEVEQKVDKLQDFLGQKIEFMKMEIESDMASKTVQMLEQKSKKDDHLSSSSLQQINSKIAVVQLQSNKHISRLETTLKDQITEVRREVTQAKDQMENKIEETVQLAQLHAANTPATPEKTSEEPTSDHQHRIHHERVGQLHGEMSMLKEGVRELRSRVEGLQSMRGALEEAGSRLQRGVEERFVDVEEKLNGRVEKVMFLVTKIRGDSIIRNEFNDKEIKELKKSHIEFRERLETTWKLLPGMGECINLVMALIFDAEYQHSKIIQDSLPVLSKDVERFNTCCEGVIYEFKEKKKPGLICYRHLDVRKADLVRATFHGYIQLWEEIFEGDFKQQSRLLPKTFYKRLVEKYLKGGKLDLPPSGSSQVLAGSSQQLPNNYPLKGSTGELGRSEPIESLTGSFHIRKKRQSVFREREREESMGVGSEDMARIRE